MIIKINPIDMLFFRDGKPFVRGEDLWTNSLILPNLSTIYGALRSAYFAIHMDKMHLAGEKDDPTLSLRIKRMLPVTDDGHVLYPAPLDLVCHKEDSKSTDGIFKLMRMQAEEKSNIYSSLNKSGIAKRLFVLRSGGKQLTAETISGLYLKENDIKKYLYKNALEGYTGYSLNRFVEKEPRINIARKDHTKAVEDGMLYRIDHVRYKNLKLMVEFDGIELPEKGYLKLGGKGSAARYEKMDYESVIKNNSIKKRNSVKLYLTSPGIFKNGWIPDFLNKDSLKGMIDGKQAELIAACGAKPDYISGYDMKNGREKPIRSIACAGNIYLFRLINECEETKVKNIQLETENACEGYGNGLLIYE